MKDTPMSYEDLRQEVLAIIKTKAYKYSEVPFMLASSKLSHDYVDLRQGFSSGVDLRKLAQLARAELENLRLSDLDKLNVGGMTMGADPLSHALSIELGCNWFSIRKEAKTHGTRSQIEGATLSSTSKVIAIEDTLTTGSSLKKALDIIKETGAKIYALLVVLDRGNKATQIAASYSVKCVTLFSYLDLGIEPV